MNINLNKPKNFIAPHINFKTKLKDFFNLDAQISSNKKNFNTNYHLDLNSYKNILHCIIKLIKIDNKLIINKQNKHLAKKLMLYIENFNLEKINSFDDQYQKSLQNIFTNIHKMLNSKTYNLFKLINKSLKLVNIIGYIIFFLDIVILFTTLVLDNQLGEFKNIVSLSSNNDTLNYITLSFYISLVVLIIDKVVSNYFNNTPIKIIDKNFYSGHYFYVHDNSEFIESIKNNSQNNKAIKSIIKIDNDLENYDDILNLPMNCTNELSKYFS